MRLPPAASAPPALLDAADLSRVANAAVQDLVARLTALLAEGVPALRAAASVEEEKQLRLAQRQQAAGEPLAPGSAASSSSGALGAEVLTEAAQQDEVVLYPPGRLLYIRRDEASDTSQSALTPDRDRPLSVSDLDAAAAEAADLGDDAAVGGDGLGESTAHHHSAQTMRASSSTYTLLEVKPGASFGRILIEPDMLRDHRCRSYREALLQLLRLR